MIEALWAVAFVAGGVNRGAGVIIFESGRIFGGDSQYYYTGEYWLEDRNRVRGELTVTHYAGEPNSIFGPIPRFQLVITDATVQRDRFVANGHIAGSPNMRGEFHLRRLAELP